jgi:hypothetical protein
MFTPELRALLYARLAEQHSKTPVTRSVTATVTNAKDADRVLATGVQKIFKNQRFTDRSQRAGDRTRTGDVQLGNEAIRSPSRAENVQ